MRIFLAAFMIVFRPTNVFESMGEREQSLFESAGPLISCFERIVDSLATNGLFYLVPFDLTVGFLPMLLSYLKCFKAWKVPDEVKLTCRIKHALLALYQAEEHLPPDEPEDSKLKIEFRTQIARLRSKLTQIAGSDALAEFEVVRAARPVVSSSCYTALPCRMTNEQLAHELLLDPAYQLSDAGCEDNAVMHRIRKSFHQVRFRLRELSGDESFVGKLSGDESFESLMKSFAGVLGQPYRRPQASHYLLRAGSPRACRDPRRPRRGRWEQGGG